MLRRLAAPALLLASSAVASASDLDYDDFGVVEPRILDSVFNLSGTTFNPASILAALLIGILFALTVGQNFLGGGSAGGSNSYGQQSYGQSSFYARSDKKIYENDLAVQMQQLAHAFKKYEVSELECHMYVACEAAMENKHEENGVLARKVFEIMSRIKKHGRESVDRKDKYVGELLGSFLFGQSSEWEDPCVNLRSKCYEATKKPQA